MKSAVSFNSNTYDNEEDKYKIKPRTYLPRVLTCAAHAYITPQSGPRTVQGTERSVLPHVLDLEVRRARGIRACVQLVPPVSDTTLTGARG